jgi:hypothetical protein
MSPTLLLFGAGSLLLVAGLLGGGLEMRELKIPRVGRFARVLATGAGAMCILLGIGMSTPPEAGPGDNVAKAAEGGPVHFTVRDQLGETQISEKVTVIVDGRRVGDLTVNADYPESEIEISVDEAGRHDYTVDVSSVEANVDGSPVERRGTGQGSIVVEPGAGYSVSLSESGDTRNVTLVAD